MRRSRARKTLLGLTVAVLVLLVPALSPADTPNYTCGSAIGRVGPHGGYVCVRAVNEAASVFCGTTADRRPTCSVLAIVGGEAISPTGDGMNMNGWALVRYGPVQVVRYQNITYAFWLSNHTNHVYWGIASFRGFGPAHVYRNLSAPPVLGTRNGCLTVRAEFSSYAGASTRTGCFGINNCINGRTFVPPVQHNHTVQRTYCVPQ
jgi:hypothetical protein